MKKFIVVSFILFIFTFNLKVNAFEYVSNAKGAILIEEQTGEILYTKNEHDRLIPASMTKIMSLILVSEKINNNSITLEDEVTISAHAASMGGSQVYLKEGEVITVEELLKCVTIVSANDACVALAELTYGSEEAFVSQMNQKVKDLGLENTLFQDTTGLTDVNHYSSPYDMAMMSKHLLNNYKDLILPFTSTYDDYIRKDTDNPFWLVTTNKLVKHVEGLDGLKTGYISTGGYCLSATMVKDNMRLISVVMGYKTSLQRNTETVELLNYGFNTYKQETIIPKGEILLEFNSLLYKPNHFYLTLDKDITIIKNKNDELKNIRYELIYSKKHNTVPMIIVYYDEVELGKYNIIYNTKIEKRNFIEVMQELFKKMIS